MKPFEELMLAATPSASVALCTLAAFAAEKDRRAKKADAHAPTGEFIMIHSGCSTPGYHGDPRKEEESQRDPN